MLEATFSPLVPIDESQDFYIKFYHQYSFIQVNDIFINYMKQHLREDDIENLLYNLDGFNEDQSIAAAYSLASGIMNPALMRARKENRGLSTEIFNSLKSEKIDPLDWYAKAFEFLMVYATCEQAIKEYLVSKDVSSDSIKENTILNRLFDELKNNSLNNRFIQELSNGSANVLKSQNELISAWQYYTQLRHSLVHSGGRTTKKAKEKMENLIFKNKKEFNNISASMFWEISLEDDNFFTTPFESMIVTISDKHLNFFRNLAVLIVESIERTIHPHKYETSDFDPYKL